jgi:hypothetical protein
MNKEKLKHLPINLFSNIGTFGMAFSAAILLTNKLPLSIFIGFVVYLHAVRIDAEIDYLGERIKKLENK